MTGGFIHVSLSGTPALPEDVHVEDTVDGVRYSLPVRTFGRGHTIAGGTIAVFGVILIGGGGWWILATLANGPGSPFMFAVMMILPALVTLIGIALWVWGAFLVSGRTDLELSGSRLQRIERSGMLRWSRSRPIARLSRLRIDITPIQDITASPNRAAAVQFASLIGEYESGRFVRLIVAYPPAWLEAIAHDLADRLAIHPARQQQPGDRPEVVVRDAAKQRSDEADPVAQPPDSAIEVKPLPAGDGLTITIPPLRMRDRKGAFSLGAAWNGVMAVFAGGTFGLMSAPWYVNLGIAGFWVVSILVLLVAVSLGRRSAIIDVIDDSSGGALLITQRSFFGVRQRTWRREELRTIECGPSGMEVNEQPVMQLQITPASGGTASFFTGRDEQELRWLARLLRETLRLPEER